MPGRLYEAPDTKVRDLTPAPWCRDVMTAAGEEALRWCTGRDGCICRALLPQLLVLSPIAKRLVAGEPALIRDVTPGCAGRNSFLALAHADGSGGGADCTPRRALRAKKEKQYHIHLIFFSEYVALTYIPVLLTRIAVRSDTKGFSEVKCTSLRASPSL